MLFDVICRYPVRLWWVCLASDHIPDPRFLSKFMRSHAPFYCKDGCFFYYFSWTIRYPLLVFAALSFAGYDITSHPLSINETTAFSDGEQDSADFWTLSLHLAEYFFFIVWWLYLYYSKWPRYRWQISVNSGTQKSKHHHIIFIFTILMYPY